jgi:hypothetical protein
MYAATETKNSTLHAQADKGSISKTKPESSVTVKTGSIRRVTLLVSFYV